jgi:hypothetical protein
MFEEEGVTVTAGVNLVAVTVSVKLLEEVIDPEVPVTVSVYCPGAALLAAMSVSSMELNI